MAVAMNAEHDSCFALFDGDDGGALVLVDWLRVIRCMPPDDPADFFAALDAARTAGCWSAVAADYSLGSRFEPGAATRQGERAPLRAWVFARAERLARSDLPSFLAARLASLPEQQRVAGVAEVSPSVDELMHAGQVERIHRWIADGDCYQINLTFPIRLRVYGHPFALYAHLRERQPVRYGAFLSVPDETILSFSPELFFARSGPLVVTRPMKGTAARGRTPAEDAAQRARLLASAKERAENVMIVDLLRNDLGRLASPGKVRVTALCEAEAYPSLWQLVSTITADLPEVALADVFAALFPCGSITGAPKIRAMQLIAALEKSPRGLYTGALGWLAPNGDCRFNVAIRTLEVAADGQATLGVGSGIVADSDAGKEYRECLLKAQFVTAFDPGFELIETLRLDAGTYPLLEMHLDRLGESARALGFTCPLSAISAALANEAQRYRAGVFRVRLSLAHNGAFQIAATPLVDERRQAVWRVVLASERLPADDYLRRHKTTARAYYDRVLAQLAATPEVFDALFVNTRGEVCEGARSNIFVERAGVLLTPPLACGLLGGVLRRSLLDAGRAVEHILRVDDLRSPAALYVGNAVRGLLPARLDD